MRLTLAALDHSSPARVSVNRGWIGFGLRLQHKVDGVQRVNVPRRVVREKENALSTTIAQDRFGRARRNVSAGMRGCGSRAWLRVVGVRPVLAR